MGVIRTVLPIWGDPLHVMFFVTCTEVALVGATCGLAERQNIRTSNLFFYSITVFPASLSPSLSS